MKIFLSIALIACVAMAEPPRNRYFVARQESAPYPASGWRPDGPAFNLPQRQQQVPDNQYGAPNGRQEQVPDNQYGAPNGRQQLPQPGYGAPQQERFRPQPAQQQQQPRQQYGPPQYGPPQQEYPSPSAPFPSSTEYPGNEFEQATTVQPEFAEAEAESSTPVNEFEEDQDIDQPQQQVKSDKGQYYVALPDGRLQRVQYVSRQDLEAMRYFAKIKAENVEPLRGPIYAYSPLQELVAAAPVEQPSTLTVTAGERKPEKLRQPKVDIRPLAQVQYQHDAGQVAVNTPSAVLPLSSSYTTFTANYAQQLPATVPVEDRLILAYP